MQKTILIVDDDPHIREVLAFALTKAGMQTIAAEDGARALALFASTAPSLIVLDITMPEMDGLEVCRTIRKTSNVPILFLSSRDDEIDRIIGLEIGGDDYVTKPFSPRELVARVNVILKRSSQTAPQEAPAGKRCKGYVSLVKESYTASWKEQRIELTSTEFDLCYTMLKHPEKVFSRDNLMEQSYQNITVSDRTIDSHIRHIRSKFAEAGGYDVINTVHGVGYKLGICKE